VLGRIKAPRYSRIPVYEENLDHIIGILYTKDFLFLDIPKSSIKLKNLIHKAEYVPGYMKLNELLLHFMRRNLHIALVTDEYGGVDGLVSFEDIMEELVGEIQDEFDSEEPMYISIGDGRYKISALIGIDEFNERFKRSIVKVNYETLGGFLLDRFGRIPAMGEELSFEGIKFKILEAEKNRIISIEANFFKGASK